MLNRLYTEQGLRHIGLEGYMAGEEPLDLAWAHSEPYFQPDQDITIHEDVMAQMTQEGEFTAVELIGLLYFDVVVDGIDNAELYDFSPPDEAWDAPDFYLYYIALAEMSDAEYTAWEGLYNAEQYSDAFEFAMGSDEFTAEMYAKLSDPVNIVSAEAWLTALDEIAAQAEAVEADLTEVDAANLEAMREYFDNVSQRSGAMAAEMLNLANANPEAPLAMNIGALHTEYVVELLTEAGVSFAVIRPISLAEGSTAGLLSAEAYKRKQEGFSVAPDGWLGSFMDGRKKPGPGANKERIKKEVELRKILQIIAEVAKLYWDDDYSPEKTKGFTQEEIDTYQTYDGIFNGYAIDVLHVTPGDENNPNPTVSVYVEAPDGVGKIYSVRIVLDSEGAKKVKIEDRLKTVLEKMWKGYERVYFGGHPEETGKTTPQHVCSTTEVTEIKVIEAGG